MQQAPSSSSSSSAAQPAAAGPRKDVLLGGCGSFRRWAAAVEQTERDELAKRQSGFSKRVTQKIAMAQVNAWMVTASRHDHAARQNFDIVLRKMVCDYMGDVSGGVSALGSSSKGEMRSIAVQQQNQDIRNAVDYYLQHIRTRAEQGDTSLEITRPLVDGAPRMRNGAAVALPIVISALQLKGFSDISTARGMPYGEAGPWPRLAGAQRARQEMLELPLSVTFAPGTAIIVATAYGFSFPRADQLAARALQGTERPLAFGHRYSSRPGEEGRWGRYVNLVAETRDKAVKQLVERFDQVLATGSTEYVVTREVIDQELPKLPNGTAVPLNGVEARALHPSLTDEVSLISGLVSASCYFNAWNGLDIMAGEGDDRREGVDIHGDTASLPFRLVLCKEG
ncbi:unnamed protein product [Amoebophrya sp. A25]|nr:unnamed protein product [Amoebophrya sp. A25]|eukprot:GSA25T00021787001.1